MKIISTFCFFLILLLGNSNSFAQKAGTAQAVTQLFDKPEKILWVKHYEGRFDDLNDVSVTLGYDGKHCKGQLKYLRSREVYGLAGFIKNNKIRLQEINWNQEVSGYIEGKMENKVITGEWSKHDNSVGGNLVLKELNEPASLPGYCGDNKWIRTFNGTVDRREVELMLQRESEGQIHGRAYFYSLDKTFEVKGTISEEDKIILEVYNSNVLLQGVIDGFLSDRGIIEAGYTGLNGKQQMCSFWKQEELPIACTEFIDYVSSYDITYPKSKNRAFNQWINSKSADWMKTCREESKRIKENNKALDPDLRSSVRAYGWCDLDYVSPKVISGALLMSSTWELDTEVVAFNFDLDKGNEIHLDDLFKKDFDYQKFVWAYLSEDIKDHKHYKNYGFRKWLANVLFESFTIRKDGINFSTTYNSIYGQQKITVPYHKLAPHFKKKSPIWALVNIEKE